MLRFLLVACLLIPFSPSIQAQPGPDETERDALLRRIRQLEAELQKAPVPTAEEAVRATMHMLEQSIEVGGLSEKVKLKQALEYFNDKMGGKLAILVDRGAFSDVLGPNTADPYEEEVSLPPVPKKMKMSVALRLLLSQVGNGHATYLIHGGFIEITTLEASTAERLLRQHPILASYEKRPLKDVLDNLGSQSGLDIHLDSHVEKKAELAITARFRNVSLSDALVVITETSGLKYVVLERAVLVTTPQRAEVLQREEKERAAQRKLLPLPGPRALTPPSE